MHEETGEPNPLHSDSHAAWDRLIEAVNPASLMVVIERRLGDGLRRSASPEDIWQESLLHAWRDRNGFQWRGLRSFRSWLLSIIDHRILAAATRHSAQKRGGGAAVTSLNRGARDEDPREADVPLPLSSTTPSRVALYREQAAAMRTALDALPAYLRDVVHLRLFEQLTLEEVGERLGVGVPAVRYRLARGIEQYRMRLRAYFSSLTQSAVGQATGPLAREGTADSPPDSSAL